MKLIETREQFKEWCITMGCTKDELADLLGVTRQTIYNWMEGKRKDQIRSLENLDSRTASAQFERVPAMLTLSLFAIEQLGKDQFLAGKAMRKRAGQFQG